MTTIGTTRENPTSRLRCWGWAVGSSMVGASVVWGVSRLGDVDLTVSNGDAVRAVGWPSVLVASAVAALAGVFLLQVLQRRLGPDRGRTIWTGVAGVVFLVSLLLGPLSATTATGMICLSAMHLAVLAALVGTSRRC